ncbi:MAG TPA: BON domain-containing protein [Longimicrobiales bacterium]
MTEKNGKTLSKTALKVGIFGAVALGAAVSGFVLSRQGRRFVKDVWEERERSPLEDRVLDALFADRRIGRRPIEVQEIEPGVVVLVGRVRNAEERRHALNVAAGVKGIVEIEDQLDVGPRRRYRQGI